RRMTTAVHESAASLGASRSANASIRWPISVSVSSVSTVSAAGSVMSSLRVCGVGRDFRAALAVCAVPAGLLIAGIRFVGRIIEGGDDDVCALRAFLPGRFDDGLASLALLPWQRREGDSEAIGLDGRRLEARREFDAFAGFETGDTERVGPLLNLLAILVAQEDAKLRRVAPLLTLVYRGARDGQHRRGAVE